MSAQQSKRERRRHKELTYAKRTGDWRKAILVRPDCPTPTKRRFNSRESAETNAGGKRVYRCPCGEWHLTNKGAKL